MSLHSRRRRQTSTPSPSGSTRSMIAASGGRSGGDVERLLAGLGGDRLEAGLAQDDLQRAQDLRLVVADEHARGPRSRAALASALARRRAGPAERSDDEARALPGQRLDVHAAAVGLDEAP